MKISGEMATYELRLEDVGVVMNRWDEEFLPAKATAYWSKDESGTWVIEVVNISGPGILKKTGELGTRTRTEWYDAKTVTELPGGLWAQILANKPLNGVVAAEVAFVD
jgi:hypothetical protein